MRRALTLSLTVAATLLAPDFAAGQPTATEVAGAWECRLPGQSTVRPPILWIAAAPPAEPGPERLRVDGFAGVVNGEGRLASGADGWSRFDLPSGPALWIKPVDGQRRPRALLARLDGGAAYRCLRLPYPPAQSAAATSRAAPVAT